MNETANVIETTQRWAEAERTSDVDALREVLADDFRAVGPVGFVLDKEQWIGRHDDASYDVLTFENVDVRHFGDTAVAIGDQRQDGTFRDHRVEGTFRITQVLTNKGGRWRVASIHLSPIAERLAA